MKELESRPAPCRATPRPLLGPAFRTDLRRARGTLPTRSGRRLGALLLALAATALPVEGRQDSASALADRFAQEGWVAPEMPEALAPCTDGNPFLAALLARDLDAARTQELARRLGVPWSACPAETLDGWLVENLRNALQAPTGAAGPQGACLIDCPIFLRSPLESALWQALALRQSPNAATLWLEVAEAAPTSVVEGEAVRAALRTMSADDRFAFFLENYRRPDLPGVYEVEEVEALAPEFIRRSDGRDLIALDDVPATRGLTEAIGRIAAGAGGPSAPLAEEALALLAEALEVVEAGARYDRIWNLVENVRVERRVAGMAPDERVAYFLRGLEGEPRPLGYQANEPMRLLALAPTELLAAVSPRLLIRAAPGSGVESLLLALGTVAGAGGTPVASQPVADAAMEQLQEALELAGPSLRRAQIERVIDDAARRRAGPAFPDPFPR